MTVLSFRLILSNGMNVRYPSDQHSNGYALMQDITSAPRVLNCTDLAGGSTLYVWSKHVVMASP
jgi:hypothetical protein